APGAVRLHQHRQHGLPRNDHHGSRRSKRRLDSDGIRRIQVAKQSGLGDALYVGGYDIGADISAISSLSTPRETLPSTGITAFAMERLYGKRDGMAEFTAYFNPAAGQAHEVLSALPTADVHLMYLRGQGLGNAAVGLVGKQVDYAPNRSDDGSLTMGVSVQSNSYGIDWGQQLTTGRQTDASAA